MSTGEFGGEGTGQESDQFAAFETTWSWRAGALAGLIATVVMGVVISLTDLATLQEAIAGLYGQSGSLVVGWAVHLVHGVLFGLLFAAVLTDPSLYRVSDRVHVSVVAGVVYGLVLAVVGAGIVMPMWLSAVAYSGVVPVPNVTVPLLAWHLVYGAVLGVLFPYLERL